MHLVRVRFPHIAPSTWEGGAVGEARRTVNPFPAGEWVRIPPLPPSRSVMDRDNFEVWSNEEK